MYRLKPLIVIFSLAMTACGSDNRGVSYLDGSEEIFREEVISPEILEPGYLYASITFKDLPTNLRVNNSETKIGETEFIFEILFDIDHSQNLSDGDIVFELSHKKVLDSAPKFFNVNEFSRYVGTYNASTNSWYANSNFPVEVANNVLTFMVPKSLAPGLELVGEQTQVAAKTVVNIPTNLSVDYVPSAYSVNDPVFTSVQSNELINDSERDYNAATDKAALDIVEVAVQFE